MKTYEDTIKERTSKWEDQSELKQWIKYCIDKGGQRTFICNQIIEQNESKWSRPEIHKAMTELREDGFIKHFGKGFYKVTDWMGSGS